MFNLGFTMEELMFPENYQSNFFFNNESSYSIDKFDELSSIDIYQEPITIDDDDDWFTIKQLNLDTSSNDNNIGLINDQTLPLLNTLSSNSYSSQIKSMVELDGTITAVILPNLSIKIGRDKNNPSSSSLDTIPSISSSDQRLLTTSTHQQQPSNKQMMSKSTSSLSFRTQSSTSMTSSSIGEMSPNSNDLSECIQKSPHHYKHIHRSNDDFSNIRNRRRRKRTIFTPADIEYLKEAFIQNPKPSQQDIAILSEQLGHDSYVIRVWFYNKRQATKKRIV